jgi:hypothetical protein
VSELSKFTLSLKSGDNSLTIRTDILTELEAATKEVEKSPVFRVFAPEPQVRLDHLAASEPNAVNEMVANVDKLVAEKKAEAATGLTGDEATAAIARAEAALAPGQERASAAVLAQAAKKSGKTVEELDGISKAEATKLIKGGS